MTGTKIINLKKILVTGSAGFIGFHLVNRLVREGYEVVGLDNINAYYDVGLKYARLSFSGIDKDRIEYNRLLKSTEFGNYRFIKLDLEDADNLNSLITTEEFDVVCNLAAQPGVRYSLENPQAYINSNIVGFANLIEACRRIQVKHFVFASSSSVYGMNEHTPFSTHDNVDHPISLYAASKKSNELMAHTYSHLFNIPTTGLRFFTAYGPWGRPDMALFLFTDAILKGNPIKIFNFGKMKRDFTYIDDIIEGVIRVIEKPAEPNPKWDVLNPTPASSRAPYRIYNIGNNNAVNLMDFVEAIEAALGKTAKKELLPLQPGDVVETFADVSDLVNDFGYQPLTNISEGVAAFIDWYKSYYGITVNL